MSRAKRILLSGALDASRAIPGLRPDVLLQEFANEAAVYLVRFHVPDFEREAACRDTVASGVLRALHSAGLEIARFVPDAFAARPLVPTGQAQRAALLRHVDLFHPLDETERADLASHMAEHLFKTGEVVFRQGDVGDSLWILSEGILDISVESDDGDATIIARIVPGELFGEMSLLTGEPRTASVTAETDAVAYEIRKEQFGPMLRQRPGIADGLATIMAARLATNARRSHDFEMPQRPTPATRDALLGRLRSFFGL